MAAWPQLSGITRIDLAQSEDQCLTVILRTGSELSSAMFSLPCYAYPLPFLLHRQIVLATIAEHVQDEWLRLNTSELMVGAIGNVTDGATMAETKGTLIDTKNGIWHVPAIDLPYSTQEQQANADLWRAALYSDDSQPDAGPTSLDVIHAPDRDVTTNELERISTLAVGYNYLSQVPTATYLLHLAGEVKTALASAEPIVTYS